MSDITRVGVVGVGLVGSGIAEVCARAGLDVVARETDDDAGAAGQGRIMALPNRGVKAGRLTQTERDAALERLTVTTGLDELTDRDLIIEAATENPEIKVRLFGDIDAAVKRPDAILATNTPSIPIVEVIPSALTSEAVAEAARGFGTGVLGKAAISAPDRSGFVVNALLVPYLLSAIRMLEAGHATAEDIDTGMALGCAQPMGPLRLADRIGLDTLQAVADSMYVEYSEPLHAVPPLLRRMTSTGLLGRKTGHGFYDYEDKR
jgi:3-hydroxybutyryl-CoA dehydrogenase